MEAVGDIDTNSDNSECSTNKLAIIKEITWQEVLELVNLRKGCTGLCNSGNCNCIKYAIARCSMEVINVEERRK